MLNLQISEMRTTSAFVYMFILCAVGVAHAQDTFYYDPSPVDKDVIDGKEAVLECGVNNRKHIQFHWVLNNRPLVNTTRRYQDDSNLRFVYVSKEEDTGAFRCIATNTTTRFRLKSTEASLNIQWLDKYDGTVTLRRPRTMDEIATGIELALKCDIEGNPVPTQFIWYKNNEPLRSSDRVRLQDGGKLKIIGISIEDNGVYSCVAKHPVGDVRSTNNFILNIPGDEVAQLRRDKFTQFVVARKNGQAQLHCEFDDAVSVQWYQDGSSTPLQNTSRISVYNNGSVIINQARSRDAGFFKCAGVSQDGPTQYFTAQLRIASLDEFGASAIELERPPSMPKVVPVNRKFEAHCFPPDGFPRPIVRWEGPSGNVIPETGRIKREHSKLIINNAQQIDTGNYSCIIRNIAGERRANLSIIISVPPTIVKAPRSVLVNEDESAVLSCKVSATPYPVTTITWIKEGTPLAANKMRYNINYETGVLRISHVQVSDKGNYACLVNTTGHPFVTSTNGYVNVKQKLKFKPKPVNTKLEKDSNSKVHCNAEGQTTPVVRWLKGGNLVFPEHIRDEGGILHFAGVKSSDTGYYTCVATSSTQGIINATIYIDVVVKPKFKIRPKNTTAYEGYPMMLHCVAIGDPAPTIQWDKNQKVNAFDLKRFKVLNNGSLYVSEVHLDDRGKYGCTAGNRGGFQREEIFVDVASADQYLRDQESKQDDAMNMMKTILIAVCSAVAYLGLVLGLTIYCSLRLIRARKYRRQMQATSKGENGDANHTAEQKEHMLPKAEDMNHINHVNNINCSMNQMSSNSQMNHHLIKIDGGDTNSHISLPSSTQQSHTSSSNSRARRGSYDRWQFPRHDLVTLGMLGKGEFGDVFLAKACGIKDGHDETLVMVKSLTSKDEHHHFQFRAEIEMYSKLSHENVAKLLGVCREMEPQFMIMEYCDWGDMKQFLAAMKRDSNRKLTLAQKITMMNQVAMGMECIANHRYVHKDVAARNVLLSSNLDLKVANLSLCHDVYSEEYYLYRNNYVPLRWMAPEALLEDEYSTKSDVWAFGVFIWEVLTLGEVPFKRRTNMDVLQSYEQGTDCRPEPLQQCPEELHTLMNTCWCNSPKERPSFSEISIKFSEMTIDSDV